mmetsp:Transcript_6088/g.5436  ORF Transcript_6088/g.5436 Transcript_6088/m.5436 type:complete len:215 (+) Transcript_6088:154-798(+)
MGNNPNKFLKEPEIKEQLDKFDQLELIILHKLFVDLANRDYDVLNKETFLLFFPLTGLWGERLFEKFDIKRTGHINYAEFVKGIRRCCKSEEDDKIKFLFDLYDTNNDGYIEKRDMITMLYNYPKNYINFITDELAPDKGEKLAKVGEKQRQSISQIIDDEDKKNRKNSRLPADAEDTIMEDNEVDEAVPADERKTIDLYEMDRDIKTAFETYK